MTAAVPEQDPFHFVEPLSKGARCHECAYWKSGRGPVPSTLPPGYTFAVVAESPGKTEVQEGRTLIGPSGREIRTALKEAGQDPNAVAYLNAIQCQPEGGDLKADLRRIKKEKLNSPIDCCRPRLLHELQPAKFAILMGGASLAAVGVDGSIMKLRGSPVKTPAGVPTIPIPHAAYVMRDEGAIYRPVFRADVNKAVRISRGGNTWQEPPYFVPKTVAEVHNFLAVQRERVAVDVETDGKDSWTCNLRRIGIGTNREVMIYSPLSVRGHMMLPPHEVQAQSRVIADYFQRQPFMVTWNGIAFDSVVLWRHGMPLPDERNFDGMVAHQIGPTSELPHRLDFAGSMYTDAPFWKDTFKHATVKDDSILDKYLASDIGVTHESAPYVNQNLVASKQEAIYTLDAELFKTGRSMSALGVWVDPERRWKFAQEYQEKSDRLRAEFIAVAGRDINPGSYPQVRKLLYEDLGLPMLESHITDSGEPSTDEPALLDLLALGLDVRARKVVQGLLGYREAEKLLGTNLGHIVNGKLEGGPLVHTDGCVRTTWRPGKRSGRWGSSDPLNMQNIPHKLRAMFRPRPGNRFVAADMNAVELRMIALLADDRELIEAFKAFDEKRGPDVHTFNACTVFRRKPEEITKKIRDMIKRFVYALSYDAQPPTIYRTLSLLRNDDLSPMFPEVTLAEVERLFNLWWRLHPSVPEWKKKLIYGWRHNKYIATSIHGRRRYFIGGEAPTEMPNHEIQGCIPAKTRILTRRGLIPIGDAAPRGDVWTGTRWASYTVLDRGPAVRAELCLANGQTFQCDTRHQVLIQTESRYEFRHYDDLAEGDRVCLSRALPLEFGNPGDSEEFYWLGFATGNGSTERNGITITFGDRKNRYLKSSKAVAFSAFVARMGHKVQKWRVHENKVSVRVEHRAWRQRWEALGYGWLDRAYNKRVPKSVWSADLSCRRQFVLGLLDSDGSVGGLSAKGGNSPGLHMCQAELLSQVQQLLRTCGVESSLHGPYKPDNTRPESTSWRLDMSGLQLFRHFGYGRQRQSAVAVRTMPVPSCVVEPLNHLAIVRGALTPSQLTLRLRARSGGQMHVYTTVDLYAAMGTDVPECYASYPLVKKRSLRKRERTYTLSVDDPGHRFDSEGIISKNTCAAMQNDAIRALVAAYPFDYDRHRGLLINGHDQLVVECGVDEVPRVKDIVQRVMAKRIREMLFPADPRDGDDWAAAG